MTVEIEEVLKQVMAEEAADELDAETDADADVGPESHEEDPALQGEEALDGDDEGELAEDDEAEDEGEDAEDEDESEDEGEEPEAEEEPEPKADSAELQALREQVARQEYELRLIRQEREARRAQAQQPQRSEPDPQLSEALRIAFSGGDNVREELAKFPMSIRREAAKKAERVNELARLQVLDPGRHYMETLQPIVEGHIKHLIQGLEKQSAGRRVEDALAPYREELEKPGAEKAVASILESLDLEGSYEARLKVAMRIYNGSTGSRKSAKAAQRAKSKQRDADAQRGARRRRGRGKRRGGGRPAAPKFDPNDLEGYAKALAEQEKQGLLGPE